MLFIGSYTIISLSVSCLHTIGIVFERILNPLSLPQIEPRCIDNCKSAALRVTLSKPLG